MNELPGSTLQKLGLTEAEASVYIQLLGEGVTTAGRLARVSLYSRPKIYEILEKLVQMGLAETYPTRPIRFRALDPELAIPSYLRVKHEELHRAEEELKRSLGKYYTEKSSKDSGIFVNRGLRKSILKYCDLLRSANSQVFTFLGWVSRKEIDELIETFSGLENVDVNLAYFRNTEFKEQIREEDVDRLSKVVGNFYIVRHLPIANPPVKFLAVDDHSLHITFGDYLDDGTLKDVISVHYHNIPVIRNIASKAFPEYFKLFTELQIFGGPK